MNLLDIVRITILIIIHSKKVSRILSRRLFVTTVSDSDPVFISQNLFTRLYIRAIKSLANNEKDWNEPSLSLSKWHKRRKRG